MTTSPGPKNPTLQEGNLIATGVAHLANVTGSTAGLPLRRTGLAPRSALRQHGANAGPKAHNPGLRL